MSDHTGRRGRDRLRVLAIVQAGGAGGRMDVLTRERAKPTLPFAGVHQLVDFPLSNLAHSRVDDVWLSVQHQGASLEAGVVNGRPWDLDRTRGGLRLLMPQQGSGSMDEDGFAQGNADELFRRRDEIAAAAPDVVLVMSADHVYRMDYRDVLDTHLDAGAECTVVVTEVPAEEAGDHLVVHLDDDRPQGARVRGVDYKPEDPGHGTVSTEVFAYDPTVLVPLLDELHRRLAADSPAGDSGLGDFGDHLLPALVGRGRTVAHRHHGYWRDLGRPHRYLRANLEAATDDLGVLAEPGWPILTHQPQRVPARVAAGAEVSDSLLSPGSHVAGTVCGSVLGPGVVVHAGALVVESVLGADCVVEAGARLHRVVLDEQCRVGRDAEVGHADADLDDPDAITLVGPGSSVGPGVRVPAGARLEAGSTA